MDANKLKALRQFFGMSIASFRCASELQRITVGYTTPNYMQQLHEFAYAELIKDDVSEELVDDLIEYMDHIAEENGKSKIPDFIKGKTK